MKNSIKKKSQRLSAEQEKLVKEHQEWGMEKGRYYHHSYSNGTLTEDDYAQDAYFALREAARRYNPQKGTSFATYANEWIRNFAEKAEGKKSYMKKGKTVNIVFEYIKENSNRSNPKYDDEEEEDFLGEELDSKEMLETGENQPQVRSFKNWGITDKEVEFFEPQITMNSLDEQERYVINATFPLDGSPQKKKKDCANELGITPQRFSQIKNKALQKLRLENKHLKQYYYNL